GTPAPGTTTNKCPVKHGCVCNDGAVPSPVPPPLPPFGVMSSLLSLAKTIINQIKETSKAQWMS
ncbi:hypothetical protein DNTS_003634, partial [Danionella cerebrum]